MWACAVVAQLISTDVSLLMVGVRKGWEWEERERVLQR